MVRFNPSNNNNKYVGHKVPPQPSPLKQVPQFSRVDDQPAKQPTVIGAGWDGTDPERKGDQFSRSNNTPEYQPYDPAPKRVIVTKDPVDGKSQVSLASKADPLAGLLDQRMIEQHSLLNKLPNDRAKKSFVKERGEIIQKIVAHIAAGEATEKEYPPEVAAQPELLKTLVQLDEADQFLIKAFNENHLREIKDQLASAHKFVALTRYIALIAPGAITENPLLSGAITNFANELTANSNPENPAVKIANQEVENTFFKNIPQKSAAGSPTATGIKLDQFGAYCDGLLKNNDALINFAKGIVFRRGLPKKPKATEVAPDSQTPYQKMKARVHYLKKELIQNKKLLDQNKAHLTKNNLLDNPTKLLTILDNSQPPHQNRQTLNNLNNILKNSAKEQKDYDPDLAKKPDNLDTVTNIMHSERKMNGIKAQLLLSNAYFKLCDEMGKASYHFKVQDGEKYIKKAIQKRLRTPAAYTKKIVKTVDEGGQIITDLSENTAKFAKELGSELFEKPVSKIFSPKRLTGPASPQFKMMEESFVPPGTHLEKEFATIMVEKLNMLKATTDWFYQKFNKKLTNPEQPHIGDKERELRNAFVKMVTIILKDEAIPAQQIVGSQLKIDIGAKLQEFKKAATVKDQDLALGMANPNLLLKEFKDARVMITELTHNHKTFYANLRKKATAERVHSTNMAQAHRQLMHYEKNGPQKRSSGVFADSLLGHYADAKKSRNLETITYKVQKFFNIDITLFRFVNLMGKKIILTTQIFDDPKVAGDQSIGVNHNLLVFGYKLADINDTGNALQPIS